MNAPAAGVRSSQKSLAIAALLVGAAAIAFAPIFVRLSDTSPTASAFWRVALSVIPLWSWVLVAGRNQGAAPIQGLPWKALVLAGLFFAGDLAVWHVSIRYTSVANSTLEANFAPLFVTLGAWLLFRQKVSRLFLIALGVTLAGGVLLVGPNFGGNDKALLGDALGVLTAVFYASYFLALKSATGTASTARIMAVNTSVAALALLPYALLTADTFLPQSLNGWLVLAGLALIPHVAGQSLIAFGFAHLPASFSAVSLLLQPVLAAIYAWVLLGEGMSPLQIAGGLVVLLGIYLAKRGS
jgi:drug/metabolite transporter (DMT)-like permease